MCIIKRHFLTVSLLVDFSDRNKARPNIRHNIVNSGLITSSYITFFDLILLSCANFEKQTELNIH